MNITNQETNNGCIDSVRIPAIKVLLIDLLDTGLLMSIGEYLTLFFERFL